MKLRAIVVGVALVGVTCIAAVGFPDLRSDLVTAAVVQTMVVVVGLGLASVEVRWRWHALFVSVVLAGTVLWVSLVDEHAMVRAIHAFAAMLGLVPWSLALPQTPAPQHASSRWILFSAQAVGVVAFVLLLLDQFHAAMLLIGLTVAACCGYALLAMGVGCAGEDPDQG